MSETATFTNRLAHESSPYLRQHAHNPVDWYPWGPEALERARRLNRPIFLSIGYSACHWCHVMERESFESEEIAKILNEHFVSIKVDREERPDLDQIYMTSVQLMTGQGGWPMSVFLMPDLRPFYGGTYFPPDDHLGGVFARYSTDAHWLVPHFEKMLYDNALLTMCYLEAYQYTGDPFYREIVEETLAWAQREMTSPEGPFYSTLDADSEGEEGKFYVWTQQEVEQVLDKDTADLLNAVYGVEPEGNWEDPHEQAHRPKNILNRSKTFEQIARLYKLDEGQLRHRLAEARASLLQVRSQRIWPGRDE